MVDRAEELEVRVEQPERVVAALQELLIELSDTVGSVDGESDYVVTAIDVVNDDLVMPPWRALRNPE